jgi:hypothetical protein
MEGSSEPGYFLMSAYFIHEDLAMRKTVNFIFDLSWQPG